MKTFYFYVRQTELPDIQRLMVVWAADRFEAARKIQLTYGDEFWSMQVFDEDMVETLEPSLADIEAGYDRYARGGN